MMKSIVLLATICACCGATPPAKSAEECNWNCNAPWTKTDIALQGTLAGLQIVDWAQTRWFIKHPDYLGPGRHTTESNPFLGENPSVGKVNNFIAASIIGHAVISHYLPSDYRTVWQGLWIVIEFDAVNHNRMAGVKLSF